jgi:8-oxo-dGTP diphosphatase
MPSRNIHVSVGVILNSAGQVLLSKRSKYVHQGDVWEFPGGKLMPGEDSEAALYREIFEELGLQIVKARPFIQLHYNYPGQSIILYVWLVLEWNGRPHSKEGQPVQWVDKMDLSKLEFPPANVMIIKALQLPHLYLISPGPRGNLANFYCGIIACINAGAKLLQLRCNEEILQNNPDIINRVLSICRENSARLLLNSSPATAAAYSVDGVHLNSVRLLQINERPLDKTFLVSASCHNQNELVHAARVGVDFVVLSPVKFTSSHPDANPLGWNRFTELVKNSNIPVYALGGMLPEDLQQAWHCGAQGVAMLSGVWSSDEPAEIVRGCFPELSQA